MFLRTDRIIDDFQGKLTIPVAMRIADYCRGPDGRNPLTDLRQFASTSPERRRALNLLAVVIGPFGVARDERHTYWQGLKVIVGDDTVAAVLCRLNDKTQSGGFYNVKLWDLHAQQYTYHGDPGQLRQIHPEGVIRIITEHLSSQFHLGFVEDDQRGTERERVFRDDNTRLLRGSDEENVRAAYERTASTLIQGKPRSR